MRLNYRMFPPAIMLLFLLFLGAAALPADVIGPQKDARPLIIKGRLEVQFEKSVDTRKVAKGFGRVSFGVPSLDMVLDRYLVQEAQPIFPGRKSEEVFATGEDMSRFYELSFPEDVDINTIISALSQNPNVRTVAPVFAVPLSVIPNDTHYGSQWYMPKIMAPCAWDSEKGSDTAKIAIIDSGVLYGHPDLIDKIWVNPGEDIDSDGVVYDIDDLNGLDDDGNGLADDLIGYDFFSGFSGISCWSGEDCGTPDTDPKDFNGHGTHCAGIAGATTNNATGGAGIGGGWGGGRGPYRGPRIMCIRVGGSANDGGVENGYVNTANCATGIDYAVRMGATAINCSWGSQDSPAMRAAVNRAADSGVVIAHAAGNDGIGNGDFLDYYTYGTGNVVISVASTDGYDRKSGFSNYGSWVDISAPGENIYNTYSYHYTPTYGNLYGTSMAAPMVCGLAALIKSHMPQLKRNEIDTIILYHADTIDYLNPLYLGMLGAGRINACSSLSIFPVASFSAGPILLGPAPLAVNFTDLSPVTPSSWNWTFGDAGVSDIQNPSHTYMGPGVYSPTMTITAPKGTVTEVLKNLVVVTADTMKIDSVAVPATSQAVVTVYLSNRFQEKSIIFPFTITGSANVNLDSVSVVGTRASYFAEVKRVDFDPIGLRYSYSLRTNLTTGSSYLKPGAGTILKLYISDTATVHINEMITIDTANVNGKRLKLESLYGDYIPVFKAGKVYFAVYQRGDANRDGNRNIQDITYLINFLYKGGPAPDPYTGDVNDSGTINISDVTYLINFLYKGGPPPPQ
ncbi:MAG: S8 family serine peptidase [candidate division Zixibacteria bacterium]|nr:S8 family serine peptidase [candidate division Zixibacteria bacterium]